jgi:hypothetical protein
MYLEITEMKVHSPIGDFISWSVTTTTHKSNPELQYVSGQTPQEFLQSKGADFYIYDIQNDVHYGSREILN